jgi:enoyl-CoA hydratase/carnithine racemase
MGETQTRAADDRFPNLTVREDDGVAWVTITRPGDRNALDTETIAALQGHLAAAETAGARAIVYQGAGGEHFIGGADGVEMASFGPQEARAFSEGIQALFERMEACPLFLVAAIDGLCFGGGLEFALSCDLRIASDRSRLGLPEVRLGIIPGGGGTQRLPRVIGFGRAAEMVLGGRLVGAEAALSMGLVHAVVAPEALAAAAAERAARALRISPHAFAAAKRVLSLSRSLPLRDGLRAEAGAFAGCFAHGDFADSVRGQLADGRLKTTRPALSDREGRDSDDVQDG